MDFVDPLVRNKLKHSLQKILLCISLNLLFSKIIMNGAKNNIFTGIHFKNSYYVKMIVNDL